MAAEPADIVQIIERLAPSLAWPIVALLALFLLRKKVDVLAGNIAKLHDVLGKTGEVAALVDRLNETKDRMHEATSTLDGANNKVSDLKTEILEVKGMLETLSIKDQSKELEKLAEQSTSPDSNVPNLSLEEMFSQIEDAWASVKAAIQMKAKAIGVTPYLMGTKGVASTLDQMVEKGSITKRSAELTKAVSAQWQWFFRTASPKEDWLTQQVFSSFLDAAEEARKALDRRPA